MGNDIIGNYSYTQVSLICNDIFYFHKIIHPSLVLTVQFLHMSCVVRWPHCWTNMPMMSLLTYLKVTGMCARCIIVFLIINMIFCTSLLACQRLHGRIFTSRQNMRGQSCCQHQFYLHINMNTWVCLLPAILSTL
jgi:hypothetical protein